MIGSTNRRRSRRSPQVPGSRRVSSPHDEERTASSSPAVQPGPQVLGDPGPNPPLGRNPGVARNDLVTGVTDVGPDDRHYDARRPVFSALGRLGAHRTPAGGRPGPRAHSVLPCQRGSARRLQSGHFSESRFPCDDRVAGGRGPRDRWLSGRHWCICTSPGSRRFPGRPGTGPTRPGTADASGPLRAGCSGRPPWRTGRPPRRGPGWGQPPGGPCRTGLASHEPRRTMRHGSSSSGIRCSTAIRQWPRPLAEVQRLRPARDKIVPTSRRSASMNMVGPATLVSRGPRRAPARSGRCPRR